MDRLRGSALGPPQRRPQGPAPGPPQEPPRGPPQGPEAVPEPIREADPEAVPDPVPWAVPQPVPEPVPGAVPEPMPEPVPRAVPEAVAEAVPEALPSPPAMARSRGRSPGDPQAALPSRPVPPGSSRYREAEPGMAVPRGAGSGLVTSAHRVARQSLKDSAWSDRVNFVLQECGMRNRKMYSSSCRHSHGYEGGSQLSGQTMKAAKNQGNFAIDL